MKPIEKARRWAKENPDYGGILVIVAQTGRGKRSRLGTKRTEYTYLISEGKAFRSMYSYRRRVGNGICDVTGKVHHKKDLAYYHMLHPQAGKRPFPGEPVVYGSAWLYTSENIARQIGALPGQFDGRTSEDGFYAEQHPEHRKGLDAWESRKEIYLHERGQNDFSGVVS